MPQRSYALPAKDGLQCSENDRDNSEEDGEGRVDIRSTSNAGGVEDGGVKVASEHCHGSNQNPDGELERRRAALRKCNQNS